MKIEILFPEFCNLYGDISNMKYLRQCLPEAEFIETSVEEEPTFVKEKVDFIYLGPMTERMQEKVIRKLQPYKERIEELIQEKVVFLFTGNSFEVLGEEIQKEDGTKIQGLGIFSITAKQDMMHRYNEAFLGTVAGEDITLVGFKSQFTFSYGENENSYFALAEKGTGINKETTKEGIRKKNFFGTYLIGPLLILNPDFTKYLLKQMGVKEPKLAYEKEVIEAYEQRLKEFKSNRV